MIDAVSARLPAMLEDVTRIIECESPSDDHAAIARSAELVTQVLGARLAGAGLPAEPERLVIDGVTHLRWRLGGPTRVLLLGHHDTVWPHGSLATHPCAIRDGVLTGPGCFDMAIGLVQAVHACAVLAEREGADALAGVTILVTGDEEIGSLTSRALLEDEARDAAAVLVLEASGPGGALKTERKGTGMYTVTTHGRAAHAGLEPEAGINAGLELAHQLQAVAAFDGTGDGTTVVPTSGRIGSTSNTVPAQASFDIDVRARSGAELDRIDASIHALAPVLDGARVSISGGVNRRPLEHAQARDLFARATRLAAAAGIASLDECAVGGASDGNFTAALGVPTLDGLGGVGGGAHADSEHVEVAHVPHRTALLALLVRDILGDA
ncbi:M20/M25/M40 family metallo-hydrolase [Demequina activiva]|uniref:Glutamate carboxypeptidase n=1 Tax=Demequina activiva TaxID=1582364 RepID=A0A919Q3T9_9MICO|nr:M20/M25/M40 family metallo-hydrolase [Demequina activiva]GIG54396.1 glutamate carboxypeptidase [Demequina activiva]